MSRSKLSGAIGVSLAVLLLGACASEPARPSLAGVWSPSDGTSVKKFSEDGGCSGVFYNGGKPLDIGGPMVCEMSEKQNTDGKYQLFVSQGPNETTYLVRFDSDDSVTVLNRSGAELYSMTRQ